MNNVKSCQSMKTVFTILALLPFTALAAQTPKAQGIDWSMFTTLDFVLMAFAVFLLLPLYILANTFIISAKRKLSINSGNKAIVMLPVLILLSSSAFANTAAGTGIYHASGYLTFALTAVVALEFLLILFFATRIQQLLKPVTQARVANPRNVFTWLASKWHSSTFVAVEQEADLDLNHDYDGIRELDNVIPPWFTAAFILCIIFAAGYIYRYHVAKSAPMQLEELAIANQQAALAHEAYLGTQQNNIDESNVSVMSGPDLDAGKQTFTTLCAVCHKADGGGLVGPNLTDEYWIHGGALKDIFKTIKYGVPDKGMISWKQQLSPLQIAQVSNYIQTLKGTNPPDAKAQQGVLFIDTVAAADTTQQAAAADTIPPSQ